LSVNTINNLISAKRESSKLYAAFVRAFSFFANVLRYSVFIYCKQKYSVTKLIRLEIAKKKGKAVPLQPWTGPEGPRSLRLPNFKTVGT